MLEMIPPVTIGVILRLRMFPHQNHLLLHLWKRSIPAECPSVNGNLWTPGQRSLPRDAFRLKRWKIWRRLWLLEYEECQNKLEAGRQLSINRKIIVLRNAWLENVTALFSSLLFLVSSIEHAYWVDPGVWCSLDPMPTPLVVGCLDVLVPVLTRILNLSLETGCFPDNWKQADVHPMLKKPRAEVIFYNLRPISNLSFVSKLVERPVSIKLMTI